MALYSLLELLTMHKEPFTQPETDSVVASGKWEVGKGLTTAEGISGEGTVLNLDCGWVTAYTCQTGVLCTEDGDTICKDHLSLKN